MAKKSGKEFPAAEESAEALPPGHTGGAHDPKGEARLWQALTEAAKDESHPVRELKSRRSEKLHPGADFKEISELHHAASSKKKPHRRTPGYTSDR